MTIDQHEHCRTMILRVLVQPRELTEYGLDGLDGQRTPSKL